MKTEHWFPGHVREIPAGECLELLAGQRVGRLAFTDEAGPVVVPVNYALDRGTVLVATAPHGQLAEHATKGPVAFEVDDRDDFNETGWSVLLRGPAATVVPRDELATVEDDAPVPWAEGERSLVLRIIPDQVSGLRLIPA